MAEKSRGATLTILALLFVLLALSDFAKPFSHSAGVGFVFMGTRLTGTGNAIMGPLFGFLLMAYAYGVWTLPLKAPWKPVPLDLGAGDRLPVGDRVGSPSERHDYGLAA